MTLTRSKTQKTPFLVTSSGNSHGKVRILERFTHFDASYIRRGPFAVGILAEVTANWPKNHFGRLFGHF